MRGTRLLIVVLVLVGFANIARSQPDVDKLMAQSEPPIQDQIRKVYSSLNQPGVHPYANVKAFRQVQVLKATTGDKGEIVKQLAIFAGTETDDEQRPLMALAILQLLDLPPSIVIQSFAPYLDTENARLRSFVQDWFQGHDNAAAPGPGLPALQPVNYEDYQEYVRGRLNTNQEIPDAFVEYIYERQPGRALLVFYFATGTQRNQPEVLLAERIISNAIWLKENDFAERFQAALPEALAELEKLAKHKEWWARLYVAYIMRQQPELRQPAIVQQLTEDKNALVSEIAKSIRQ